VPGWREHEGACAAPFGHLQVGLFQATPQRRRVSVVLGELRHHPGAKLAEGRSVWPNHRSRVAPVIVVDSRHAELKPREGAGEGREEFVVNRGRMEVSQDGLD